MILLTVGTQLPFDRLVSAVDDYASKLDVEIIAQIGNTSYNAMHIKTHKFLEPDELNKLMTEATVVISHAGMGTIITCLKLKKPIILFPRLSDKGEHRNDHQLDTMKSFAELEGVYPANNIDELNSLLENHNDLIPPNMSLNSNRKSLVDYIVSKVGL